MLSASEIPDNRRSREIGRLDGTSRSKDTLIPMPQLAADEIPELLARLVDKSLVQVDADGRFDVLQTVRLFAQQELLQVEGGTITRIRHLEHYHHTCRTWADQIYGPNQLEINELFKLEAENLRLAVEWAAVNSGLWTMGAEMVVDAYFPHLIRGAPSEGQSLSSLALDNAPPDEQAALAAVWAVDSHFSRHLRSPKALDACDRAIELGQRTRSLFATYLGMYNKATIWIGEGKTSQGLDLMARALEGVKQDSGNRARFFEYQMLMVLGSMAVINGELEKARGYFEECQRLCELLQGPGPFALLNINLGLLSNRLGDLKGAYRHLRDSLAPLLALNDLRSVAGSTANSACGFFVAGDYGMAATVLGCGYGIWERSRMVPELVDSVMADQWRSRLIEEMGEDAFQVAFERGKTISAKDMVAIILANPEPWTI